MTPVHPTYAGAAEAASVCQVEVPRISRWVNAGRMPPTVAELSSTKVWLLSDIQALAAGLAEFPERDEAEIVGTSEVAELLGVDKSQIGRWRRKPPALPFPEPIQLLRATPLWWTPDIPAWAEARAAAAAA